MTFRHLFVLALLLLVNVVVFGCMFLIAFGRVRIGY